jgi:hypothetical protein
MNRQCAIAGAGLSMLCMAAFAMDMPGMNSAFGSYPMTRDAAGTSWQPDATPMAGQHNMGGTWTTMLHGHLDLIADQQGGPRGDHKNFVAGMLMWMGHRQLGRGTLGVQLGMTPDPLMGAAGYPLLFQSGETADGRQRLVDRQHPHDLVMAAALSFSHALSGSRSVFVYAGLPGEAALGPTVFMHRASAQGNVEAPLAHHWLDSTHLSFGVVTTGVVLKRMKLEASWFNGREPDQNRYDIELRRPDSAAVRLSYNPAPRWSMQLSAGRLASPEQLEPDIAVRRITASLSYSAPAAGALAWDSTLAWGRNAASDGHSSAALLAEAALRFRGVHTFFGRAEYAQLGELFNIITTPATHSFGVSKLSLGYSRRLAEFGGWRIDAGALLSSYDYPRALQMSYGTHTTSAMAWLRLAL